MLPREVTRVHQLGELDLHGVARNLEQVLTDRFDVHGLGRAIGLERVDLVLGEPPTTLLALIGPGDALIVHIISMFT